MSQELSHQVSQLYKRKYDLEAMVAAAGWKDYANELEAQVRANRQAAFSAPSTTVEGLLTIGNAMARAEAILIAKALPEAIIADLAFDIEALEERIRQEESEHEEPQPSEGI